ncbi:MAG: RNA pyrophosphohydrolase [Verrucomicrobiota bacterium]
MGRSKPPKLRPNVAAILEKPDGRIFVAERADIPGAWQFPQGGVDKGESSREALVREVEEEIGLSPDSYEIVEERSGYDYVFPNGKTKWGGCRGQTQTYFRCLFAGDDGLIDLEACDIEFARFQWIHPREFQLAWVIEFKREVYEKVFHDFFDVALGAKRGEHSR